MLFRTRTQRLILTGSTLLAVLLACGPKTARQTTATATQKRPNILFIMSDDHAYQAISAYDSRLIQTPNIDRIAKEGMLFMNASVTNSICAPSRAVILTGKHSHLNGKVDNIAPFDTSQRTFPQLLQAAGYQTAMFGKLHFGNNPKGFDEFKILPGQGVYYNPEFITKKQGKQTMSGYVTDIITDMTLNWLQKERDASRPFLMMYLHKAPHREWLPALRHLPAYTQRTFPEPATLFDTYEGRGKAAKQAEMNILNDMNWAGDSKLYPDVVKALGLDKTDPNPGGFQREVGRMTPQQRAVWDTHYKPINEQFRGAFATLSEKQKMQWRYQRYMQDYLGCIAAVDEGIGRVLDYLNESGLAENTIVVYTSDQGFYLGEHGWFDKRFVYNESFRTPLMIRWPSTIKPGSVNTQMVQNLDFAPTFLAAAGVPIPADMQGESLLPIFQGRTQNFREAAYYHYYEYPGIHAVKRHYAIITEQYKLIHFYHDIDEWELYDRKKDPQEMRSVYNDPAYASIRAKLHTDLAALRVKYKDSKELDEFYLRRAVR
jgi:arylsulfatase A-like enzyme